MERHVAPEWTGRAVLLLYVNMLQFQLEPHHRNLASCLHAFVLDAYDLFIAAYIMMTPL
jgi:hypothetical protein